jgi:hypothetical protein
MNCTGKTHGLGRRLFVLSILAIGIVVFLSMAKASILSLGACPAANPGDTVTPCDATAAPFGTLLASLSAPFTTANGTTSGTLVSAVYREAGGTLDFYYQVINNTTAGNLSGSGGCGHGGGQPTCDPLSRETDTNFSLWITQLAFRTNGSASGGLFVNGDTNPQTADRNLAPGNVIGFTFNAAPGFTPILPGHSSRVLIISTNATNFTAGTAAVIDGSEATVASFRPAFASTAANGNISGHITDSNGNSVEGAVISLKGTQNRKTITDANGNYSFDNVETTGAYTVVPLRANFAFSPSQRAFSQLGQHTEAAFVATSTGTGLNPLDTTEYFVRQQYVDFLGREPEEKGFNDWTGTINNCAPNDASCDRVHVSEMFFRSPEFQQRSYFVYRFYSTAFGRKPGYVEFVPDITRVSGFLTNDQLEGAKTAFVNEFVVRPAFVSHYNALDNTAYVNALFQSAGVTLSNRQALIDSLNTKTATRAQVLRQIAESGEVYQKYYNQAFVVMEYFGYLRRDPDASYLSWIDVLNQSGDSRHMVEGFVNSTEYRNRFVK